LHATLNNIRHAKLLRDFAEIARFILLVLRGSARNDFQIRDASKPCQDLLLNAISEIGVIWIAAQIFKRQNRHARTRHRAKPIAFGYDHADGRDQPCQQRGYERGSGVALQPFLSTGEHPGAARADRLVPKPAFGIIGDRCRAFVTSLGILLEALQTDSRKIDIYFRIPKPRISRLCFQHLANRFVRRPAGERRLASQHLIENRTESVNIRRSRELFHLAGGLFGLHVAGCSEHLE